MDKGFNTLIRTVLDHKRSMVGSTCSSLTRANVYVCGGKAALQKRDRH